MRTFLGYPQGRISSPLFRDFVGYCQSLELLTEKLLRIFAGGRPAKPPAKTAVVIHAKI